MRRGWGFAALLWRQAVAFGGPRRVLTCGARRANGSPARASLLADGAVADGASPDASAFLRAWEAEGARLLLAVVTLGLEEEAVEYLVDHAVTRREDVFVLPRPNGAAVAGEGAVTRVLIRLGDDADQQADRIVRAPVVQAVLAFVGETSGVESQGSWAPSGEDVLPTGGLRTIFDVVRESPHWASALGLVGREARTFRASGACGGRGAGREYTALDVMTAMGGAALQVGRGFAVDLYGYDFELYGFLWGDCFACGILLGGEWRPNRNKANYKFAVAPFGESVARAYVERLAENDDTPWYMPKLRPSTSLLLLLMAGLKDGDVFLDPMGGSGTIAIEAAVRYEVTAMTADNDRQTLSAAVKAVVRARPFLRGTCVAVDMDATNMAAVADSSVDVIVADTPFGNRCRWDIARELPLLAREVARVLKPGGRCVLLMKSHRRLDAVLERDSCLRVTQRRAVGIGGFDCYAIVCEPTGALDAPAALDAP
ncbi:putative RNA methylase family UPF0020-domain-containing protein [Pelagophyceae sp. CCMP2097]|nr:putative RNA methylase family UPF0020-domain-containing protein [Pelagophyceae sp. CCMP2097]|mmetsp:Transcript_28901/g.97451  ORF Transcript_28901/g.97451 Transcript_28901/m.97451 type:complete len:485 (-) Transcript_28901:536-1990(-)